MIDHDALEARLRRTLDNAVRELPVEVPAWPPAAGERRRGVRPALSVRTVTGSRIAITLSVIVVAVIGVGALTLLGRHQARLASPGSVAAPAPRSTAVGSNAMLVAQLRALRGRPIVLFVWASWCAPCRNQFDLTTRAAQRYAGRVAFLGIDVQDSRTAADALLRVTPLGFPSYQSGIDLRPAVPLSPNGVPTTIFIGADGRLVGRHLGLYRPSGALNHDIAAKLLGPS